MFSNSININNSDDINYRYKMQKVSLKMTGTGNGMFTTINNMDNIACDINTPPEIIYKFISYTLGSSFNEKKKTLTGHHYNIQDIIFEYINNFVICPTCGIPELIYKLDKITLKKVNLVCKCSACGNINTIKSTNKITEKCIDTITKYLQKENIWIKNKGKMV